MTRRGSQGRGTDKDGVEDASDQEGKPEPQRKAKEARERFAGHLPSPNYAYVAADPLRSAAVAVALRRLYSASEFAEDADIPMSTANSIFQALRRKGILEKVKEVPVRGVVKHMCRATEAAFVSEGDWAQMGDALRAVFCGSIVHDFNVRASQAIETGHMFSRDDICMYWAPRDLDETAWREQAKVIAWCAEESTRLAEDTAKRRANGESDGSFHSTFALAAFPSPTYEEFKAHQRAAKKKAPQPKNRAGQTKGKTAPAKGERKPTKKKSTRKAKAKRRGKDDKK